MDLFVKILNNYQNEFFVFYPYVLNFSKKNGVPFLNYFKEFRYGFKKKDIMFILSKENLNNKTVLAHIGNITIDNNNLNKNHNNIEGANLSSLKTINNQNNSPNKSNNITKIIILILYFLINN